MDESLAFCALDISGRPYLAFDAAFPAEMCGGYASELTEEFFRAVSVSSGITLHLKAEGRNTHHMIEALVEIRQGSDYDDFYLISKEEVEEQLHNAQQFVRIVEAYLLTQYPKST